MIYLLTLTDLGALLCNSKKLKNKNVCLGTFFCIIRDCLVPYVKILIWIFDQTDPKASNILAQETTIKVSLSNINKMK